MRREQQPLTAERLAFARTLGVDPLRISFVGAVHGSRVARVDRPAVVAEGCDALITAEPDLPLFATFADCYPVLLFDPVRRAAGLAHAGWRGTKAGVVAHAVEALVAEYGCRPGDLVAGIGPGVCGSCYEVGAEVAGEFPEEVVRPGRQGRFLLDLAEANRRQLLAAGVGRESIHDVGICTMEHPELPSHRRDGDGARFACIVSLRRS